jgi:hypothetical protein
VTRPERFGGGDLRIFVAFLAKYEIEHDERYVWD